MSSEHVLPEVPDVRALATRQAVRWEQVTIGYNVVEDVVAVTAGLAAGSIALVGFGFDSVIEVAAAAVVLHRLLAENRCRIRSVAVTRGAFSRIAQRRTW